MDVQASNIVKKLSHSKFKLQKKLRQECFLILYIFYNRKKNRYNFKAYK